jgi:murein L,D-transpeptidase YafK
VVCSFRSKTRVAWLALVTSWVMLRDAAAADFRAQQLKASTVREAMASKGEVVRTLFESKGLPYPPRGVFIRVFKLDRELELWGQAKSGEYVLVKTYPICASSGAPGPKRQEGDGQVPEGFYEISVFNPYSAFHLSLGIDYPNASDRVRGHKPHLGSAIMIHGNCVTIGCVPITDALIEELYIAALEAHAAGQPRIAADFFPGRLDAAGWKRLTSQPRTTPELVAFWTELKAGYDAFERTHRPPKISVAADGRYVVK